MKLFELLVRHGTRTVSRFGINKTLFRTFSTTSNRLSVIPVQSEHHYWKTKSSYLYALGSFAALGFGTSSTIDCQSGKSMVLGNTKDFENGTTTEIVVEGVTVLVHHYDGKFYATSSKCSHYGYPLKKGVQNKGVGKDASPILVCPLHDAAFDVKTGKCDRGPTVAPIETYPVTVDKNGKITAVIPPKDAPARPPKFAKRDLKDKSPGIVIIGAGAAGSAAAETLRQEGYTGRIQIFTKEQYGFYDRPVLTKDLKKSITPEKLFIRTPMELVERDIELRTNSEVTAVDVEKKEITYKDGEESINVPYDKVLIASGGVARRLFCLGSEYKNIVTLRTIDDCAYIENNVKKGDKVFVIGGSFIGMETASSLLAKECDITMCSMESVPFERVLGKRIGAAYARLLDQKGIKWIGSNKVRHFRGDGKVTGVEMDDGDVYAADFVLIGAGIIPQFQGKITPKMALPTAADGSFLVNPFLQSRSAYKDSVYVAGDCATFPSLHDGSDTRIEHWDVATNQGRLAAKNMLGHFTPFTTIPFFWTRAFGKTLNFVGRAPEKFETAIIEGDLSKMEFIAYFQENDKIVGAAVSGRMPLASVIAELLKLNLMPPASDFFMRIANGDTLVELLKKHNAGQLKK